MCYQCFVILILNFNEIYVICRLCFISLKVRMNLNDPFYMNLNYLSLILFTGKKRGRFGMGCLTCYQVN